MASMKKLSVTLITLVAISSCAVEGVKYIDCFLGKGHATVNHIEVNECKGSGSACDLQQGSNVTVNLKLTTEEDFTGINFYVDALHVVPVKFQRLAAGEVCRLPGVKCPGKAQTSEEMSITFKLDVTPHNPVLGLFVLMYRDDHQPLVCQTFRVSIKGVHKPLSRMIRGNHIWST